MGTCFGFAVRSSLPFHFLRGGDGEPMDVSVQSRAENAADGQLIVRWSPTVERPFEVRLYRSEHGFGVWIPDSGWYEVDIDARSVTIPDDADAVRREERLWGVPATLLLLARADLSLHAAAVEVDGQAIVLAAPGTFGKTTLAAAFVSAGYRLLSEDVTCVRTLDGPHVVPGPAMLRVRRDVAERIAIENVHRLTESEHRVHFAVDEQLRGDCSPLPLRAVVLLRLSDDGHRVETADAAAAVRDLWCLAATLPTDRDRTHSFAASAELVRSVPVWNFFRPLRYEELPNTIEFLVDHV